MKIQTSDLIDEALNWAVSKCEWNREEGDWRGVYRANYSTDWAYGGPIIDQEMISLICNDGTWEASCVIEDKDTRELCSFESLGETPLIAAMRCYVVSKLGNEVEVPENFNA